MGLLERLRGLFRRDDGDGDLEEELRFHLEMREQRNVDEGMGQVEARRAARVRFGNPVVLRERMREVDLMLFPQTVAQDVRFGLRTMARNPGFTFVAVFALAVGIGINTAAFTAYRAFFERKLDARDPGALVNLALIQHDGTTVPRFSYPDYEAYRDDVHSFSGVIAASAPQFLTISAPGGVAIHSDDGEGSLVGKLGLLPSGLASDEMAITILVSENYFSILGVGALRGRVFKAADAGALASFPGVVISENYWQKKFGGDPSIVGKSVRLNGAAFTIIGVSPHNFVGTFVAAPDFWIPLSLEPLVHPGNNWLRDRESDCCRVFGRLAAGTDAREAQAEAALVADHLRSLHDAHSDLAQPVNAMVWPGSPFPMPIKQVPGLKIFILCVMAAVGMVLVVACANVASLQLARAASRQNELAMRLSLGASRWRIIRQLLTESALLGLMAGVLAFCCSWALLQGAVVLVANAFPEEWGTWVFKVTPDPSVFGFVFFISLLAGVLFGLAPALESSGSAVSSSVKASAAASPRRSRRLRNLLIATQIAMSAVLVIVGSLLIHSAIRALRMDTGYDDAHVIDLTLRFPESAAYTPERKVALIRDLRARVAAIPGVTDVTSARAPDDEEFREGLVSINGEKPTRENAKAWVFYTWIEPNYFRTLGIPLAFGKEFAAQAGQAEASAIVSESAARELWPGKNPLGRILRLGTDRQFHTADEPLPDGPVWRVIGVAHDTRGVLPDGVDSAQIYLPLAGNYVQAYPVLVRTRLDPTQVISSMGPVIDAVDPNVVGMSQTLEEMLRQTEPFLAASMAAAVASTTGLLGLLLAAIGIYGTVSYMVVLRTREVGIRMALGAQKRDVLGLILRESGRPVVAGLVVGVVLAGGVAYLLRHILYGIHTIDGVSFGGVTVFFLGIALLASLVPSRRAMRIEPVTALRYE
jgi:predicted permease